MCIRQFFTKTEQLNPDEMTAQERVEYINSRVRELLKKQLRSSRIAVHSQQF
jgi:hypothetical protein